MSLSHVQDEPSRQVVIAVRGKSQQLEGFQRRVWDKAFNPSADAAGLGAYGRPDRQPLEF